MDLDAFYVLPPTLLERLAGGDLDPPLPGAQPSLLERMLGDQADESAVFDTEKTVLEDARRRLRAMLAQLLGSRRPFDTLPARFADLADSVIGYGLPDVSAVNFRNSAQRHRFRQELVAMIAAFEPRLEAVAVLDTPASEIGGRKLAFRLSGHFVLDRRPVPFDLGTALNDVRGHVTVDGGEGHKSHGR